MRELKFRAWVKEYMKMIENVDLLLPYTPHRVRHDGWWYDDCIIMQYTCIKDKHDKEIYEGDIVKSPCGIHKVIFADGGYCLDTEGFAVDLHRMIDSKGNHLEVIGNIYEDPELLEVEEC